MSVYTELRGQRCLVFQEDNCTAMGTGSLVIWDRILAISELS